MELENSSKFMHYCRNGQLEQAKELYHSNNIDIHVDNKKIFRKSCRKGHLDVVQWLYSLGDVDIHANDESAFIDSCRNGHLNVAQWLYSLGTFQPVTYKCAFGTSCRNGHLNVAQWLYSLGNVNLFSNINMRQITQERRGHAEARVIFAEMLTDNELENSVELEITFNEWLLGGSCQDGYLNVAQWLWGLDEMHKTQLLLNGCIFSEAVNNGQLKVVKWLYSLGKIDINNEINQEAVTYVFTYPDHMRENSDTESSESEYSKKILEVAKWLIFIGIKPGDDHQLYPYYLELKRKQFKALVTLCVFVLNTQRKVKEYWYNPDDGVLMLRAKKEFELLQKKIPNKN